MDKQHVIAITRLLTKDAHQQSLLLAKMDIICIFPKCVPKIPDFVVFPFSRTRQFENWWINSGWSNVIPLNSLPDKILICEEHFEPDLINRRHKIPKLALGALPTRNVQCPVKKTVPSKQAGADRVYCRLCGQKQTCNLDEDLELLTNLDEIFQYQLHLSDFTILPTGVCFRCKALGNTIQTFWKKCFDAQETLKTIFNNKSTHAVSDPSKETSSARRAVSEQSSSANANGKHSTLNKREPSDCEEIVIDISQSEENEEHYANQYGFASYGEELPTSNNVDECDEELAQRETGYQLQSDDYTIESGDESSSEEWWDNVLSTEKKQPTDSGIVEENPLHICEICGNSFKTLNGLKAHINLHSDVRNHQCNVCGHKFKTRRSLKEHVESKHEHKIFPCKICGVQYSWKKGLERHMSTTHRGKAPAHICKVCDKAFPVPHKLKMHMMLHTGDRIHCEYCGKGYRFNYMLTQHKIRVHEIEIEGVKLYKSKKVGDRKKGTSTDVTSSSSFSHIQESTSC